MLPAAVEDLRPDVRSDAARKQDQRRQDPIETAGARNAVVDARVGVVFTGREALQPAGSSPGVQAPAQWRWRYITFSARGCSDLDPYASMRRGAGSRICESSLSKRGGCQVSERPPRFLFSCHLRPASLPPPRSPRHRRPRSRGPHPRPPQADRRGAAYCRSASSSRGGSTAFQDLVGNRHVFAPGFIVWRRASCCRFIDLHLLFIAET